MATQFHRYDREELLALRSAPLPPLASNITIPFECIRHCPRRGKRAGVRLKTRRRKNKLYAPTVVFGNVRSLNNKIDELRTNCRFLHEYRDTCILGLTESWLNEDIPDGAMDICGYQLIRNDRSAESGKSRGGGLALYINEKWANNISVKNHLCTPDIELLSVTVRPFFLPRDFTNIFVTIVYIPPDGNKNKALDIISDHISKLSDSKPDALHLLFGDFNNCKSDCIHGFAGFEQYVTCSTRGDTTLDLFLCNISDGYKCKQLPPLKSSDHHMIHMLPSYRPKLKQTKPTVVNKQLLDNQAVEKLNACFDCTDWSMFVSDANGDVNTLVDVVTCYITFCRDLHCPVKTIKLYPNNKPWIKPSLRQLIIDKNQAHGSENHQELQNRVNSEIRRAKMEHKEKVESLFTSGNSKDAWRGLKVLLGTDRKQKDPAILCSPGAADRINTFYARFDTQDFSSEIADIKTSLLDQGAGDSCPLQEDLVRKSLKFIKVKKAAGPDKLSGNLLKLCSPSLFPIIHSIFDLSLSSSTFPSVWKVGEIVPVPKKVLPMVDNDLRPVTLTSILSKCLERVGLWLLMPHVKNEFDPLQFAYVNGRSTEDATCHLIHRITSHLDAKSSNSVRATFIDYSSAFNTIQPHLLLKKLSMLHVPPSLLLWILDYLTERPQYVRTKTESSSLATLNCGAPQGCVLSPILFVLYTNDLCWESENVVVQKYADDTVILGFIKNDKDAEYKECIEFVNNWCNENYLTLNVSKTKELVWDFRRQPLPTDPIEINGTAVDKVSTYKYLGLVFDSKLSFAEHVQKQVKKANSRIYCLRVMKKLNVSADVMVTFFNSCIPPLLMYAAPAFFSTLTKRLKHDLDKPRRVGCRIMGQWTSALDSNHNIYNRNTRGLTNKIIKDKSHPLHGSFRLLPSGRYSSCYARTARFGNTFVPTSLRLLNDSIVDRL